MLGITIAIIIGALSGFFFRSDILIANSDRVVSLGLCLLLFFVGMDIGDSGDIFPKLKKFGKKIWFLPISTIIGSLIGGYIGSIFTTLTTGQGIAVSAGLGWYSLSAIELSKISAELGSLAFLTNVLRELLAIFSVPFIAKYIGSLESVSVAGATAMDTLLPIINRNNSADISIVAFFSGIVLTTAVPFLVTLCISIFNLSAV
ncbi:lysine exporter LysO family protein [Fusobacterium perfoetens]|uniref:lysine exporter LysO family protein n=1 Tax=Fusobacterium perfoetens TaxID=852 RepID=UPI001F34ACC2|nr:lysine exporter LysO family protein [Fusobacterium perfoetens]MCF2624928.1 lysine exporter LysO family protein [Fusobacterium perfoetens]